MVSKEKIYVQFENVEERYLIDDNKPMKVEYVVNAEYEPSTKDWLGIFPKGWRRFEQQLLAEWAVSRYSNDNRYKRIIDLDLSYLTRKMNCFNADYQLVYISKTLQVVGRSSYFRLQRKLTDVHSHGDNPEVFNGTGTAIISPNLDMVPANIELHHNFRTLIRPCSPADSIVQPINCAGIGYPLVRPYRSECVVPHQGRDYISARCLYCPDHLQRNKTLFDQVKDLADVNREMRKRIIDLEQRLELSLVAQKRLKIFCYHMRQEKQSYEVFVSDLLKCLRGNAPVYVRDYAKGSEMLVQRVTNELEDHLNQLTNTLKRSPLNERHLKAVIFNQEMKLQEFSSIISDLTYKLSQFEMNAQINETNSDIESIENSTNSLTIVKVKKIENEPLEAVICDINNNDESE